MKKIVKILCMLILNSTMSSFVIAHSLPQDSIPQDPMPAHYIEPDQNVIEEKIEYEVKQDSNPFALTAYEPNYILPANYSFSTSPIYQNNTPNNQRIQHIDFKFQFSLKTPIWRNFFGLDNDLYLAYTQQSFWQAYNSSAFFRANNYQPEIFLQNNVCVALPRGWNFQLFNVGLMHQSNGRGGMYERTWNRVYLEGTFSKEKWLISIRPWLIISEKSAKRQNRDIEKFLGHGRLLIAYKCREQVISLILYNNIESGFKRGSIQLSYSFPLIKKIKGYIQAFSGYGQSLLEYNHRNNSIGVGISFSDWL